MSETVPRRSTASVDAVREQSDASARDTVVTSDGDYAPRRNHVARSRDALFVAAGVASVTCGIALSVVRGPPEAVAFAVAFGVGQCANTRRLGRAPRTQATVLAGIATIFLVCRIAQMAATNMTTPEAVVVLVLQTLALGIVSALTYEHAHGVAQLSVLFGTSDRGYAPILDEASSGRTVEAELARSRRRGTSLPFLLFETHGAPRLSEFSDAVDRVSSRAVRELDELYVRQRISRLISLHARRSDLVVCLSAERLLVLSADTDEARATAFAQRIVETAASQLGTTLCFGVASYPTDGSTYTELIAAARGAADKPDSGAGHEQPCGDAPRTPSLRRGLVDATAAAFKPATATGTRRS